MLEREILWRLMTGPLGPTVRGIGVTDSSLTYIGRAVRWITEHYDRSFRVEELARTCGMSVSAFHRAFHAVTALSPIQFQKQIRLQRSRLLLLSGGDDVATVAYRVGYDSASQFSREYRRQFGLPRAGTRPGCAISRRACRRAGRGPRACSARPWPAACSPSASEAPNERPAANSAAPRNAAMARGFGITQSVGK